MKLYDYGDQANRSWFRQIIEWSRKKITFQDNIDCQLKYARIGTSETQIGHNLGRRPQGCIEVCAYPSPQAVAGELNGTAGLQMTKDSDDKNVFLKRPTSGEVLLLIF